MNKEIEIALKRYGEDAQGKTYPWCAVFINEVLAAAGKADTDSLLARSFLNLGEPTETPEIGDITVFWREAPDSWKGHAGFYIRADEENFWILGGNQDGIVKIKAYPKWQLLGHRKLNA